MHKFIHYILKFFTAVIIVVLIAAAAFLLLRGLFPSKHSDLTYKYCKAYNVDRHLVLALIKAESNFRPDAVSHAGAKGLMQLTDDTFEYCMNSLGQNFSKNDIFIPDKNIRAGVWYLGFLLKKYDYNTKNAIAAYNAGSSNVDKWLCDERYSSDGKILKEIPFGETLRHVEKINSYYKVYKFLY